MLKTIRGQEKQKCNFNLKVTFQHVLIKRRLHVAEASLCHVKKGEKITNKILIAGDAGRKEICLFMIQNLKAIFTSLL